MAVLAKRDSVINLQSQTFMLGKRFDVVGMKIASSIVAAFLAGVRISRKYGISPIGISEAASVIQGTLKPSMGISVVLRATFCFTLEPFAYFVADFFRPVASFVGPWLALSLFAHAATCFFGMSVPFECRRSAF